jgi:serine protease Do
LAHWRGISRRAAHDPGQLQPAGGAGQPGRGEHPHRQDPQRGGPVCRNFQREPFGREQPFNDFFERFFGEEMQREFKQPSLGSGFIIDKEGYVVTNNHVIEDADQIKVKLGDEKEFDAQVIGRDASTDLALLKIKSAQDLPVVKLGDSAQLKVGQWVVAIGSPFGLERTVTAGIVSAKGRVIGSGPYDDFIQTDASINPGNSGGPLINLKGEVIGINTAIVASGQGIGFAIPIDLAKGIIAQLKAGGEVTRGWLGVAIQDVSPEMADYYGVEAKKGVFVADVFKGDPADAAGIKPKDIIVEVNGQKVETTRQLTSLVADIPVGQTAKVKVLRDGQPRTLQRQDRQARRQTDGLTGRGAREARRGPAGAAGVGIDSGDRAALQHRRDRRRDRHRRSERDPRRGGRGARRGHHQGDQPAHHRVGRRTTARR